MWGISVFIVVELLFTLICKQLCIKLSIKKLVLWNSIPLIVLIFMFLYLSFDKDFLLSSVSYVFY